MRGCRDMGSKSVTDRQKMAFIELWVAAKIGFQVWYSSV